MIKDLFQKGDLAALALDRVVRKFWRKYWNHCQGPFNKSHLKSRVKTWIRHWNNTPEIATL